MSMVINNNLAALTTYDTVNSISKSLENSIKKLSTGLRINSAADDAAGLAISEKMRAQISGLDQAVSNTQDGISLIQTAEGALSQTHSILQRMRELSVQAANDTLTSQDRSYIQQEIDQLVEEIDHIGNTTTFNTKNLLNGDSAVLWSSSDLNTKALINGGLRTVDQFGQKSSADGNYKITVKASAGTNQVQKTDIFKIKHDVDYDVVGSGTYAGAAVEGTQGPALDAVGQYTINITTGKTGSTAGALTGATVSITLNRDIKDAEGLAQAINTVYSKLIADATATSTALGDHMTLSDDYDLTAATRVTASVDDDGNLVLTGGSNVGNIKIWSTETAPGILSVLGITTTDTSADAKVNSQTSILTGTGLSSAEYAALGGTLTAATITFTFQDGKTAVVTMNGYGTGTGATAAAVRQAVQSAFDAGKVSGGHADDISLSFDDSGRLTVKSTGGSIANVAVDATGSASTLSAMLGLGSTQATGNFTQSSTLTVDAGDYSNAKTNFGPALYNLDATTAADNVARFKLSVLESGAISTSSVNIDFQEFGTSAPKDAQAVATFINNRIAASGGDMANYVKARVDQDSAGNDVVRLYARDADIILSETASAAAGGTSATVAGSLTAVFGSDAIVFDAGTETTMTIKNSTDLTLADTAQLNQSYSFALKDTDGKKLGSVTVDGPFDSTNDLMKAINKKLAANSDLADFTVTTTKDDNGNELLAIYSATRDFTLADGDDVGTTSPTTNTTVRGYKDLFGVGTEVDAEKNKLTGISTIGDVANANTVLRDIDKFWDSQGNFMLDDPQTLTITQGDGQKTDITIYGYDTIQNVVDKLNTAIADTLGQANYLDKNASNYETAKKSFVTFVDSPTAATDEAVQGTFLIRSAIPGKSGTINIASSNESFYNAFSLNTIKDATESEYYVTIEDAHSGNVVNGIQNEKITGNILKNRLHENVDVEFNALTGISAKWDDDTKTFSLTGTYDSGDDGEVTYLHLSDNTMVFQIGANKGDDMAVNIGDMRAHALGVDKVLVTDRTSASNSISIIDNAIDKVSTQRAKLGAYQNRLEYTASNLTVASENLTSSESRIRDTDMASEMMNFTKLQILQQAGISMLAQANQLPQNILSLVR